MLAPDITPLASIVIVAPSTFTPPNIVVLAVGKVYAAIVQVLSAAKS